jgi:hypothetical protein
MVAISMHLLNKQDELKISIILDGGGVVLCMNNISKVIWGYVGFMERVNGEGY